MEFNDALVDAIDETIREVLSPQVLDSLYVALKKRFDVGRDELPYRVETLYELLAEFFGVVGSRTLSRGIARRLFQKLDLEFKNLSEVGLEGYVEEAKRQLDRQRSTAMENSPKCHAVK